MCWYRYSYVSKSIKRDSLERSNRRSDILDANFVTGYHDLPNKNLAVYSLFPRGTKAKDVDYDLIMYDTYDYIDKLIGFKLSDIFYATFERFFIRTNDQRAWKLARLLKYGTDNERFIWMLRYGLSFEDIDLLDKHIEDISEQGILFKESIYDVPEKKRLSVSRFL